MKLPNLDTLAHSIISHAKDLVVALHPKEEAAKVLPLLASAIKSKADELLIKAVMPK